MLNTGINGRRVYRLRLAKGWTQDDLAFEMRRLGREAGERLKTNGQTIRRIERGQSEEPRGRTVAVLAAALGVSIDELYGSNDDEEEDRAALLRQAADRLALEGNLVAADVLRNAADRIGGLFA